jgi:hypothetical protein
MLIHEEERHTMSKKLWWLGVAVLAFALVGQYAVYRYMDTGTRLNAAWADTSTNFNELANQAHTVVVGRVQAVTPGKDIVIPAAPEPGGEIRIPTQNVRVAVEQSLKGNAQAGQPLTVFRTGGQVNLPQGPAPGSAKGQSTNSLRIQSPHGPDKPAPDVAAPPHPDAPSQPANTPPTANNTGVLEVDDDPQYAVGERYFFALTDGPEGTLRPVSPAGRYRVTGNNTLEATGQDDVSASMNGRSLGDAQSAAQGKLQIPAQAQVQRRVTTGGEESVPGMPTTGNAMDGPAMLLIAIVAAAALTTGVVMRKRRV